MTSPAHEGLPSRRTVLGGALAASFLAGWSPRPRPEDGYAPPTLDDDRVLGFVAGLRPYRQGGIRLEAEERDDGRLVHAYGHGGCGVTLSWGTALEAADLVAQQPMPSETPVAVLGAGAVGLATARVLQERGHVVHLYAHDFPPRTTSNVAGALWLPTGVDTGRTRAERERFGRIASRSWERFSALEGREYGVRRLSVFDALSGPSRREQVTRHVPTTLKEWPRLPVRGTSCGGFEYTTLLVEPPVYMPALLRDVLAHGARVEQRTFADADDVRSLDEPVVVNCMGLGAGEVFADDAVLPVRGQLVHLHPEPLDYALSFHTSYMFPRGDAVVLGGTFEDGVAVAEADPRDCAAILRRHRDFFGAV